MVFVNTIAPKIARVVFDDMKGFKGQPSKKEKNLAYAKLLKIGLPKTILMNMCFRNLNETVPEEKIMLAQLLKKPEAHDQIVEFIQENVDSTKVLDVPNLDIWEQKVDEVDKDYWLLYEDNDFKVIVKDEEREPQKWYMRTIEKANQK